MALTLIQSGKMVTMDSGRRIIEGGAIVVDGNRIVNVLDSGQLKSMGKFSGTVIEAPDLVAIPGFVQTHVHLCQTLFRGLADDLELLDWLKLRIFPFEAAHNAASMRASAMVGIAELLRSGTTTILDMGSVHHEEEVVGAIQEAGLRAFVGKAMMDVNDVYPRLKESTRDALTSTRRQAEQWHGAAGGRIRYAVAPRFILSCTDELLREAHAMTSSFPGMLFHTHAAENRHEMDAVKKRCGMDNVEYFGAIDILHPNTLLAHCIWLNDREIGMMAERGTKVAHCPSSNLKLGSGTANVPGLLSRGISVSLGADGAPCNNTLNMFQEMRLASLIQKPLHGPLAMPAELTFELATLGGARALGMEAEIGSLEPGKKADIVLLDVHQCWMPPVSNGSALYSSIVYSGCPENVHSVMIDGQWVYRAVEHTTLDHARVTADATMELRTLLGRVK